MVAWGCPTTTQFRSKVCPSTTVGDEVSILMGGETLGTGDRAGEGRECIQITVTIPGGPVFPTLPRPALVHHATFSPWDGPLLSMVTMSEVSWEPTPLLT